MWILVLYNEQLGTLFLSGFLRLALVGLPAILALLLAVLPANLLLMLAVLLPEAPTAVRLVAPPVAPLVLAAAGAGDGLDKLCMYRDCTNLAVGKIET